ncbi:SusC/RagA family TonB-linked outer membrane protein [Prevotella stercorea]|uniref:SusC/RagA family TonB-linked outer membrane protein n=1 Tax=Leyella stercorea TaxID=363265 RepID=UPI001F35F010|nr:SusC/RagA family TonB-linked outer membrane protein [Leyella stercorea]MCF2646289.1 SusC/RagA family TonB-linked outer membrane protein [Leyella stercorea]
MQKKVLFAIGLAGLGGMVSPATAQAQDNVTVVVNDGKVKSNSISGVVYSADDNEPLIGAQVRIVGANVVTITDVNGRFSFKSVELKKQKLQVSYIGMETQTVTAGHEMKVVLKRDSKTLSDVVVNGYFTRKKQTFTGAAKTVTSDEIMKVAPNNILQTLATLDPSLNIAQNNAAGSNPNAVPDLVIRSTTSLSTSNEVGLNAPLIVIDGVEQSLQALYDMDINDIERVDILKDASATALYGENAANGVIVIERKRVSQSPVRIRYTVTPQLSFADLSSYDYCNAAQKLELEKRAGLYKSETGKLDESYFEKLALVTSGIDTDWKSKPVRNSFSHNHSLSISGRGSGLDYNVNANYQNTQGVMKDDGRTRYGMNVYLSYTAINNLVITLRASHDQLNTNSSKYGSFSSYLECNPYDSPYDQYGNLRSELSYEMNNPLYEASLSSFDKSQSRTQQVSLDVRYNIKPNFFITAQGSYNTSRGTSDVFRSPDSHDFKNVTNISQKGKYTLGNTGSDQWAAKLVGNYIHNFDNDGTMLTLNLGGEIKRSKSTSSTLVATGFLSDEQNDIAYATTYPDGGKPSGSEDLSASLGGFLAANFMWKNRYVLDGSYRVSGSSKFGSDHRYAPFWSVGAGWNIHNEEFAKKLGWINTLRLRGSYGYTGSVKFSSYQAVTTYKYNSDYLSYTGVGAIPMGMANPDLKWQTTKKLNVGITSSLFGDRLNVNFDVYNEKTTDMLIDRSLPPSSGTTSVKANLGSQTSNGIEFSLWGKIIKTRDLEWSLSVNGLHSKTTINNISDAMKRMNEQNASGFTSSDGSTNIASSSPLFQYREGESPSAIYAVRSAGIDPATGNEIFIKKDGSYTYKYDSKDQVSCGDTNPTLQGSISSMLQYKNFSLTASFSYRFGGEMYNSTRALKVENVNPRKNCDVRAFTDRWTNVGDVKPYIDIAKATGNTSVYTDRFVEKDDELWLSSLYLQYNVPMTFLKKLHIQKMYLGIGTEDLFRITSAKYERGTSYPFSRSINMSASLTF